MNWALDLRHSVVREGVPTILRPGFLARQKPAAFSRRAATGN